MDSLGRVWPAILAFFSSCLMKDIEWSANSKRKNRAKSFSVGKVIYGVDDRYDVLDYPENKFQQLARSTAAQIPRDLLQKEEGVYYLKAKNSLKMAFAKKKNFQISRLLRTVQGF